MCKEIINIVGNNKERQIFSQKGLIIKDGCSIKFG